MGCFMFANVIFVVWFNHSIVQNGERDVMAERFGEGRGRGRGRGSRTRPPL